MALEKVVAREAVRDRDGRGKQSLPSSALAIECADDMPEASPLSDPRVLDVLFEEEGFVKLCHGEKVEVQGKGGVWEWWFDVEDFES